MENTKIKFLNHASVLISHNEIGLLSDPWYESSVFHNGWRLIHETKLNEVLQILDYTTHIFISHEHPDHFNTGFFLNEEIKKKIQSQGIKILFQKNYDKRVLNFLVKFGFNVIECKSGKKIKLSNQFEVQIVKHDFYDSSISIKTPEAKILNLNDCPTNDERSLKNFKKKYGKFDLLITQFSYAAWKGGMKNIELRKKAANDKLLAIENQANILECKKVIPFASFIYFSNILNFYMNDSINTPSKLANHFKNKGFKLIIMSPNEDQLAMKLKQNEESIKFWTHKYEKIKNKNCKIDEYGSSVDTKDLVTAYENYKKRIFYKNSRFLIYILEKIKFLNFFQKINIFIIDKNENYEYSIFSGLKKINNKNQDISLHSKSLLFIFKNEFGFDTLTVNGCFESSLKGFSKISRNLAIGSLNAMGLSVNIKIFTKPNIILLFLSKLRNFLNKMKTTTRNSLRT